MVMLFGIKIRHSRPWHEDVEQAPLLVARKRIRRYVSRNAILLLVCVPKCWKKRAGRVHAQPAKHSNLVSF
jgi:hypothetical protein